MKLGESKVRSAIDKDSEDDETFQPPALSSYAVSLLNEINNKSSLKPLRPHSGDHSGNSQYNFQPRLSAINTSLSKRYSITHEKTGTTIETKRTSMGNGSTTPYTHYLNEDEMQVSPLEGKKSTVDLDFERRTGSPLNLQKSRKLSTTSAMDSIRNNRSQRRFAKINLGAPKRIQRDLDNLVDEDKHQSLDSIEEKKEKIRIENQEMMQTLAHLEEKYHTVENQISDKPRRESDSRGVKPRNLDYIANQKHNENDYKLEKENIRQDYNKLPATRRRILSEISPNVELQRRNSISKRTSFYETRKSEVIPHNPHHHHQQSSSHNLVSINDRVYEKLELIGKGGTSKVYKLRSKVNNKLYAIKRVTFDEFDESAIRGFKGEIDLLKKLSSEQRVVKLYDYSMLEGSLMLVMECGEIDLAQVLTQRMHKPLDIGFVRYHMVEMLECVAAVHDAGIIHSDLKPANFLFVKGILKIIDFGIANALGDHTMNIYRESQIGTPNYMSPESLLEVNGNVKLEEGVSNSTWKVGRPSDVWSCGCIIYQMVYGKPPYASYTGNQRLLLIMNPQVKISYPETGLGDVPVPRVILELLKNSLHRDPTLRYTIHEMLDGPFCNPRIISKEFVDDLVANAINFGAKNGEISKESLQILTSEVWTKIEELNI